LPGIFVTETPLRNLNLQTALRKKQKAKTFLKLSAVISVLKMCHGNHASELARTLPLYIGKLEGFVALAKQKSLGIVFAQCSLYRSANFKTSSTSCPKNTG
jgi:hypothetical protein